MNIVGIDYSYTSPSICLLGDTFLESKFWFMTGKKKMACKVAPNIEGEYLEKAHFKTQTDRFDFLSDWAIRVLTEIKPDLIILEGYAYGSRTGLLFDIAENAGLLKYKIKRDFGLYPVIVSPTTVKKEWTGKGNAKKDLMIDTLKEKEGVDLLSIMGMKSADNPASDVCDSYAIARHYLVL